MGVREQILTATAVALVAGASGGAIGAWWATRGEEGPVSVAAAPEGVPAGIMELEARLAALEAAVEWSALRAPSPTEESAPSASATDEPRPKREARATTGVPAFLEGGGEFGALLEALQQDDPKARLAAARELLESPRPGLRMRGLFELLREGAPEGLDAVARLVEEAGEDPRAEGLAARAIGMLGDAESAEVEARLYQFLEREGPVRREAARALEQRGDPKPIGEYIAEVAPTLRSASTRERLEGLKELGDTRSPQATSLVEPALRDPDPILRQAAIVAVGQTGGAAAVDLLKPSLSDPVPTVRDEASRMINRLLSPPAPQTVFGFGPGRFFGPR